MQQELENQLQGCNLELSDINSIISRNRLDRMVPYLTMYSLIKACGTIEYVFKSIVADYFNQSSITQIHNYLDKNIREGSMSPKYNNMCRMLNNFDENWCRNFKQAINNCDDKEKLKSSINSLVTNRHQFAHGKNPTVSFNEIYEYYSDAVKILRIFDSVVQ